MSAKGWRLATILLAVCCAALACRLLVMNTTAIYGDAAMVGSVRHSALLASLLEKEWTGLSEEQLTAKLQLYVASHPNSKVLIDRKPGANTLCLDGACFAFKDGRLFHVF